ncbi:MAG TPA: histidine--tRNA ligase [Dehalococcoidia bacterium]|nr:histidine--tRNA ligase [Dehalococcoidia bacterium]
MSELYRAPRGTQDILPEEQSYWSFIRDTAERLCRLFRYERIDTPVFEDVELFRRTAGEVTDVVQKEMYVLEDRGGQEFALRPEGTAPVCRAYLEHGMHNLPQPVRLWYWSPIFRYDRPQAGRYRQHHQFGSEAIGEGDAAVDAESIELLWRFYEDLGLSGISLNLNSIGDGVCRPGYVEVLRAYYADKLDAVCEDCRARYERNPLRLLDCKQERCQPVIEAAPPITDHLCQPCAAHFSALRGYLEGLSIPYVLNPRLVRGFDYYTRSVFELQPSLEGAQSAIGGGGRYDGLIEQLGGPPTPGIGFGSGIERIILNLKQQGIEPPKEAGASVFVAFQAEAARSLAFKLASDLRRAGVTAVVAAGAHSLKSQMRQANARGATHAAIIGERELADGTVTLRNLSDSSQETVPLEQAAKRLAG